jgi:hypothetical protein
MHIRTGSVLHLKLSHKHKFSEELIVYFPSESESEPEFHYERRFTANQFVKLLETHDQLFIFNWKLAVVILM